MPRFSKPKSYSRAKPLLTFEKQRCEGDCCIAALSSFLNIEYEKVLIAAGKLTKNPHETGVWFTDLIKVAEQLGVRLKKKTYTDLEKDEGVLDVKMKAKGKTFDHHAVVLLKGLIFDVSDGEVWAPERYEKKYKAKCMCILIKA